MPVLAFILGVVSITGQPAVGPQRGRPTERDIIHEAPARPNGAIDGEAAVARFRAFIKDLGIRGDAELTHLGLTDAAAWGYPNEKQLWSVGLITRDGRGRSGNLTLRGKVVYYCATDAPKGSHARGEAPADPTAYGRSLLSRIRDRKEAVFKALGDGQNRKSAQFDLVVNGRTFLNLNPRYGYDIHFDPRTGEVIWFGRQDDPPPVYSTSPRVSEEQALELLRRYCEQNKSEPASVQFFETRFGNRSLRAELGYYKFAAEPKARLMWQGWVTADHGGGWHDVTMIPEFVDATTGRMTEPDDPAWRRN